MVPDAIVQAAGDGFRSGLERLAAQFATHIAFVHPPARRDGDPTASTRPATASAEARPRSIGGREVRSARCDGCMSG